MNGFGKSAKALDAIKPRFRTYGPSGSASASSTTPESDQLGSSAWLTWDGISRASKCSSDGCRHNSPYRNLT
jgi:hypothetical protein